MAMVHLSPELPRLTVSGHRREPSEEFLSASYPSPTEGSPPAQLQRSYSGRPWSQSSNNIVPPNVSAAAKTRKSLRGLGRSRVAAGMGGWMRNRQASVGGGLGEGVNRRASASDSEEATTEQIDSAFARIREQLAKLSEEDQVLKERVERLNEEIAVLHGPVQKLRELRTKQSTNHTPLSPLAWKSPHFSMSVCEIDFLSRTSTPRGSVPVVMVFSSSRDNLRDGGRDPRDPAHQMIAELVDQEEEEEEGVSNGYLGSQDTRSAKGELMGETLSSVAISGVGSNHTCTAGTNTQHN